MPNKELPPRPLLVTTADGATLDLGPLAKMLVTTKHNTGRQQDSPRGALAASPAQVASFELGVRMAVSELLGQEARDAFVARVAELGEQTRG